MATTMEMLIKIERHTAQMADALSRLVGDLVTVTNDDPKDIIPGFDPRAPVDE